MRRRCLGSQHVVQLAGGGAADDGGYRRIKASIRAGILRADGLFFLPWRAAGFPVSDMIAEDDGEDRSSAERRDFVRRSGVLTAGALMSMVPPAVRQGAWAAGSDAPEQREVRVGFIPLTDCASVVVAATEGFDRKHGIRIVLSKESSWAAIRDKLVSGELDAAHVLYGLVYGVQMGIGGLQNDMAVLMTLSNNGQGITLSNQLRERGATNGPKLKALVDAEPGRLTFAQTFPTGTHAMWLNYWLAAHGIDPLDDVRNIVVPPVQMVANLRAGNMAGCCVGEPWNARAIFDHVGFSVAVSQDIWKDHPEKVLGTTGEFVRQHPNTARALTMAVLEASRYIETGANRSAVAALIADRAYVDTAEDVIEQRFLGHYEDGLGRRWRDPNPMRFHNDGAVNFPWLSDGMWFLTQHRRWGLLEADPDYLAVVSQVNQVELFREAATQINVPLPAQPMRSSTLIDGSVWDGSDPVRYAGGFALHA